jgi:hypothetical protein
MTIDDDDFDPIPVRRPPYDSTPYGRIWGRDKRKYARLWGIDLDLPPDGDYPGGEADFRVTCLLMGHDHHLAEEQAFGQWGGGPDGRRRSVHDEIPLEEFAAAWTPPTEEDFIEEEIERREAEAALGRRDSDP